MPVSQAAGKAIPEGVAESTKALNYAEHEEHKEELFFSLVAFVSFVVQGFQAFCDTLFLREKNRSAC